MTVDNQVEGWFNPNHDIMADLAEMADPHLYRKTMEKVSHMRNFPELDRRIMDHIDRQARDQLDELRRREYEGRWQ